MASTDLKIRARGLEAALKGLTDKQRRFVLEYAVSLNQSAAARKAGYKNAPKAGMELMKKATVQKALRCIIRPKMEKLELTVERVLTELAYCLFRDPADMANEHGIIDIDNLATLPESVRRCIDGIKAKQKVDQHGNLTQTLELKMVPKAKMIELAMQYLNLINAGGPETTDGKLDFDWEQLYQQNLQATDEVEGTVLRAEEG